MCWKGRDRVDEEIIEIPSRTYKVSNGRIAGYVDGLKAVRQAAEKVLSTERFGWLIYSEDYGAELNSLIGEDFDLVNAETERLVTEALAADERVLEIQNFSLKQINSTSVIIQFDIVSVFGNLNMEQEVEL